MTEIKQRISLDGAEDVASKLKKIGDTGADAFKKLKDSSAGASISAHAEGLEGGSEAGSKLREVLHVLHPALDEAGLGLSNLGAYSRLAGAGMVALGTAIVGSVL